MKDTVKVWTPSNSVMTYGRRKTYLELKDFEMFYERICIRKKPMD